MAIANGDKAMEKDKESHKLRNGLIIAALGGTIANLVSETIRGSSLKALSWSWGLISWTWTALTSDYLVPGWALIIIGLLVILGLGRIYITLMPAKKPEFIQYTEDVLEGVVWRWSWSGNEISNLSCFCPACDATLIPESIMAVYAGDPNVSLICEQCPPDNQSFGISIQGRVVAQIACDPYVLEGKIKREIYRRIRTGSHRSRTEPSLGL